MTLQRRMVVGGSPWVWSSFKPNSILLIHISCRDHKSSLLSLLGSGTLYVSCCITSSMHLEKWVHIILCDCFQPMHILILPYFFLAHMHHQGVQNLEMAEATMESKGLGNMMFQEWCPKLRLWKNSFDQSHS